MGKIWSPQVALSGCHQIRAIPVQPGIQKRKITICVVKRIKYPIFVSEKTLYRESLPGLFLILKDPGGQIQEAWSIWTTRQ